MLFLGKFVGVWPLESENKQLNLYHRNWAKIASTIYTITVLTEIADLFFCKTFAEFVRSLCFVVLTMVTMSKFSTAVWQSDRVVSIVKRISELDVSFKNENIPGITKIVNRYQRVAIYHLIYFINLVVGSGILMGSEAHLRRVYYSYVNNHSGNSSTYELNYRELPFRVWIPYYDSTSSQAHYRWGMFYELILVLVFGGIVIIFWDAVLCTWFTCVQGHFKVLEYKLANVGRYRNEDDWYDDDKKLKWEVKECIKLHQKIIK